jgi:hypothetical protein
MRACFWMVPLIAVLLSCSSDAPVAPKSTLLAQTYPPANACCTYDGGMCPLYQPLPPGYPCYCASPWGPIGGNACYAR